VNDDDCIIILSSLPVDVGTANNLDEVEFHEITTNIGIVGTIIFGDDAC
ncbi:unnamed protein product, partial [Rotaria sp. Silwood2]